MKNKIFATLTLFAAAGSACAAGFFPEVIIRSRPGLMANAGEESITSTAGVAEDRNEEVPEPALEAEETSEKLHSERKRHPGPSIGPWEQAERDTPVDANSNEILLLESTPRRPNMS